MTDEMRAAVRKKQLEQDSARYIDRHRFVVMHTMGQAVPLLTLSIESLDATLVVDPDTKKKVR